MKKLAVIVVLFLFLANTIGCFIVFRYNQYLVQQEMVARIRNGAFHEKIVTLKIIHPEQDIEFCRIKDSEFSYYGKMYDMVAQFKKGDTTFLYCLHDNKEEDLLADYSRYLRRNGDSSRRDNPVLTMLYSLFTQALIQNPSLAIQGAGTKFHFPISNQIILPVYLAHSAPPPKFA